jgi:serine/threonine protein kinase/WD40 repeat protein
LIDIGMPQQGQMIGRYRLLQLSGRGSVGEVWQAEDTTLQRKVAIKLLPPVLREDVEYLRAFAENASMAASLEHPHILPIHDFGEHPLDDEVLSYWIMPWIDGGSLRDRLRQSQGPLPTEIALQYLRQAAEAIDYAHQKGVFHRNVTPDNMLLQGRDLYLSDFTLARLLSMESFRYHSGINASMPEYMAPELIEGRPCAASDRYSLAVIAYELFTGRVPFQHDDTIALLLQHLNDMPPPPRTFYTHIPARVEQTILRGLAKRGHERYADCRTFVDELECHWHQRTTNLHDPDATVLAPSSKYLLAELETRRTHTTPQLVQHIPTSTPELATISTTPPTKVIADTKTATKQKKERRHTLNRRALFIGGVAAAVLLSGGGLALASVIRSTMKRSGPETLIAGIPLLKLTGHLQGGPIGSVWNVRWHPSGNYLASAGDDQRVMVWDIATLLATPAPKLRTVGLPEASWVIGIQLERNALDWSPDGKKIATLLKTGPLETSNNAIAIIDVFTPRVELAMEANHDLKIKSLLLHTLAWAPTGDKIATANLYAEGDITLWQVGASRGHEITKVLQNPAPDDYSSNPKPGYGDRPPIDRYMRIGFCWSHDGSQILQIDPSFAVLSWDINSGKKTEILTLPRRSQALPDLAGQVGLFFFTAIKRSPTDQGWFVAVNVDVAVVFDTQQKKVLHTLGTTDRKVYRSAYIWSWSSEPMCPQLGPLAWSPNGRYLAGCYLADQRIFVWDLHDPHPQLTQDGIQLPNLVFGGHGEHSANEAIYDLSWSPDGRYLASASSDLTVVIWKVDGAA